MSFPEFLALAMPGSVGLGLFCAAVGYLFERGCYNAARTASLAGLVATTIAFGMASLLYGMYRLSLVVLG